MPSTRSMKRHPERPKAPSPPLISRLDTVAPIALETGTAAMNSATALARCAAGNQKVR